ncbi:MAG: hypothetical protein HC876_10615 [Chloroflexaceae bacterium]|nr:hypothetical protein [Chloroflexaceae bacterium]
MPVSQTSVVRFVRWFLVVLLLVGAGTFLPAAQSQEALTGRFTYQGQLFDDGLPVSATCDFRANLFTAATGGTQIGSTQTINAIAVVDGYFTLPLSFGTAAFQGDQRFLELGVRCGGEANFTLFAERVALTATPYSVYALQAPWAGLSGIPADLADGDDDTTYSAGSGLALDGTTFGLDTSFTDGRYWLLGGNTAALTPTLGTTDGLSLTLIVAGTPALRLLPGVLASNVPTLIGGAAENRVYTDTIGAVIAGGGPYEAPFILAGGNVVYDDMGVIGGGSGNLAGSDDADQTTARFATVGGGQQNGCGR